MPATVEHRRSKWPLIVVGLLTVLGFALRLHQYGMSMLGDELSTLWIVRDHGLRETIDLVSGDSEITPPLYFVLAWFSSRLGSAPELVRLPALIAGTACIPAIYLLGRRTVGRSAGLVAAALMTLSPFMIFFAGSGRAYTLMLALLIGSTLAMLAGTRTGRVRWWIAYAVLSCLAVYSHYTSIFVLLAQFVWLLWTEPGARRPALLANAGAAAFFLPWLPSFVKDSDSPTMELLKALQGDGFETKRLAVEQWAFGHPLLTPSVLPGRAVVVTIATALLVAAIVALAGVLREKRGLHKWLGRNRMGILVFALLLATPVAEALYGFAGSDLFGSRNLVASSPGLFLAIGTVLTAAGPLWGGICGLAVIGGFATAAVKSIGDSAATIDYEAVASRIDREAGPRDIVVDLLSPPITPSPLTPLGVSLKDDIRVFSLNLPVGDPPFLPLTPVPDPDLYLNKAFAAGRDGRVFIVGPEAVVTTGESAFGSYQDGDIELPRGWRVDSEESYPGVADLDLVTVSRDDTPDQRPSRNDPRP